MAGYSFMSTPGGAGSPAVHFIKNDYAFTHPPICPYFYQSVLITLSFLKAFVYPA